MKINIFRNKEVTSILTKLFVIQIIFVSLIILVMNFCKDDIFKGVIDSKSQMVAALVEKHPELESEIVSIISEDESIDDIKKGKEILSSYGYSEDMDYILEPIVYKAERSRSILIFILILIMISTSFLVIVINMKKIYIKVQNAYNYVDNILKGEKLETLDYEGEGEFPILANEINKMVSVIKNDNEIINKEKNYLKEILTDISHQMKTPLTSIKMITDILIDKDNISREKQLEFLSNISIQSDKMEWLIYNLLKMARLDSGSVVFKKDRVSLQEIINVSISLLEPKIIEKEIQLNIVGEKATFVGDKEWTNEAITNILKNAIEHSKTNGKILISTEENKMYSRIVIKDNGEGIDKKDLANIFKRFYTGKKGLKSESIGVGLAMTKSIIENQGGYILVRSEKGVGTEFEITFINDSKL
ncbi:MAG: sensor histidine kinase [Clostridium sp.]|uniref:sensor histidine kinase n=1 Tax=Clostridium sp. TaxID=1506 RepID=UPI003F3A7FC7